MLSQHLLLITVDSLSLESMQALSSIMVGDSGSVGLSFMEVESMSIPVTVPQ